MVATDPILRRPTLQALVRRGATGTDDSLPASANEVRGAVDGAPILLPSGIVIQRRSLGRRRVTRQQLADAIRGIQMLPLADQQRVARLGVRVNLVPVATLEDTLLGATAIEQDQSGRWHPTAVRVAVAAGLGGHEATAEIVQHELGHVLSVTRDQNLSEEAAEAYARSH